MVVSTAEQARLDVRYRTKEVIDLVTARIGGPIDLFPRDERDGSRELVRQLWCARFGDENLPKGDISLLLAGSDQFGGCHKEAAGADQPQRDDRPAAHDEGLNEKCDSTMDTCSSGR